MWHNAGGGEQQQLSQEVRRSETQHIANKSIRLPYMSHLDHWLATTGIMLTQHHCKVVVYAATIYIIYTHHDDASATTIGHDIQPACCLLSWPVAALAG
jgi:hypothetical protein